MTTQKSSCNVIDLDLESILDKGCNGNLNNMSKKDWVILERLVLQYGETCLSKGSTTGYRKGYRAGQDSQLDLFEDVDL